MQRRVLTSIIVIMIAIAFCGGRQALAQASKVDKESAPAAPRVLLPETTFDFGRVSQDQKLTHKFKIKNTGDAPLKLIKAKGS